MRKLRQTVLLLATISGITLALGSVPAGASSANISHSFHSTKPVVDGSIVSLDPSKSDFIVLADTTNDKRLLGVAVASKDSLLAVDSTPEDVQVATSGNANMLVSTLNGDIAVGDSIAVSPFSGVGMKSVADGRIIGLAQSSFTKSSPGATAQSVKAKGGGDQKIYIGYIKLIIAIRTDNPGKGEQLSALQKIAKSLTGHTVSTVRIFMSVVIAAIAVITLITLIYASINGSIISIGRNPLAKYAVFRTLVSVMIMAIVTAGIATLTIYLLLR